MDSSQTSSSSMTSNNTRDPMESEQSINNSNDSLAQGPTLKPEQRIQKLAELGYYEANFRDPDNQQSQLMESLLSGDESVVKAEYARRKLRWITRKPDGSAYYKNTEVHLMAQVLHSNERLAEARRQKDFLEDFIANQEMIATEKAKKTTGNEEVLAGVKTVAEEILEESEGMLAKAGKWQIKSTYKPRFETLVQHIEDSKKKLDTLIVRLQRSRNPKVDETGDVVMGEDRIR